VTHSPSRFVTAPTNGTASVNGNQLGSSPATNSSGADPFTYRAGDGTLFSPAADVTVTVTTP
jgi:Bacterial Ig domain